ncbi:MAG: hypothetical protein IJZ08_05810 [Clostridia bacterium]|nr:hypothetical protein [Clostridia bacterium]
MDAIKVEIKRIPSVTVEFKDITISGNSGYSDGYAAGKADAESADAIEDAALLEEINAAIIDAAKNPLSCAETLSDVPESVGKLYKQGYSYGESVASYAADTERKEVNAVLKGYGQPGADTLGDISAAVSNGIAVVNSQAYDLGHTYGKVEGMQAEYNRFWDAYQQNGARVSYENAFGGVGWTDALFNPKYDMQPNNSYMMFRSTGIKDLTNLNVAVDFSKSTNMQYMFQWARVEKIGTFDARSCNNLNNTFTYVLYLHTIEKLILRDDGTNAFTQTFTEANALQNITIEGVIGNTLDMRSCKKLSQDSIYSIIRALSDTASGKSVTLAQAAVVSAFGSTDSGHWLILCDEKRNWTISLV